MPATPAWPPASTPRLFVDQLLEGLAAIPISGPQAHYLSGVMRLKVGDPVCLFDDRSGEWLATVAHVAKRELVLDIKERLRPRETVPDLWLLMAPIKKGRIDWMVEKACELGVARVVPVLTRRTVVDRVNPERLHAHLVEAAEQCGRTALPELGEMVKLDRLLRDWPAERQLLFADENGGVPLADVARAGPAAILIGPEGGFDTEERAAIRALDAARAITLGPRILRADTAAVAAVSNWMAAQGDWGSVAD